jgi:adenylylsulfate kinase
MKILIMGLAGSGKTTLAEKVSLALPDTEWFNADKIRAAYNDWDFSKEGRLRQAYRMSALSDISPRKHRLVDFIAALKEQREIFNPDIIIWMNTIKLSRFEDDNTIFEQPYDYDIKFDSFEEVDLNKVIDLVKSK